MNPLPKPIVVVPTPCAMLPGSLSLLEMIDRRAHQRAWEPSAPSSREGNGHARALGWVHLPARGL